jgi:hypothetical protein
VLQLLIQPLQLADDPGVQTAQQLLELLWPHIIWSELIKVAADMQVQHIRKNSLADMLDILEGHGLLDARGL